MNIAKLFACASLVVGAGAHFSFQPSYAQAPRPAAAKPHTTWSDYGGGPDQSQYSALTQINRSNVGSLKVAWTYPTGDPSGYLFNPIVVDRTIYVKAKGGIAALDAATGKELWVHQVTGNMTNRGMNYWESRDRSERRLLFSSSQFLQAIDALTGEPVATFGENGRVDLRVGLDRDPTKINAQSNTPGHVFEDLLILGSVTNQAYNSAPGDIRAFNVRTGKLAWQFHTVPRPGEYGYDTWPPDAWKTVGGANNWGEMSIDVARGIVYVPTSSPKYNFYGANRIGQNLFGDSLLALNARTGRRLWHFQMVHHDIWDYDNPNAPKLLTIRRKGQVIDVVAEAGKTGWLYVFNRVTGEPIWPIEERPVPKSEMPYEQAWPTQPFPTAPPAFARQSFTEKDLSPYIEDPAERARFAEDIRNARSEGMFTPPGLGYTVEMPGNNGGANFGGFAADPEHGTVFVVSKDWPALLKLYPNGVTGPEGLAQYESTFGFTITSSGLTAIAPPWTSLTAYDLNTGTIRWQVPLGEAPELAAKGITDTGSHFPKIGPVVTAGGLIFTGARDKKIRAMDVDTGKVLWTVEVQAGIEGIPAVYEVGGKQYVVYCAAAQSSSRTHPPMYGPPVPAGGDPDAPASGPAGRRGGRGGRGGRGSGEPIPGAYVAFALPSAGER